MGEMGNKNKSQHLGFTLTQHTSPFSGCIQNLNQVKNLCLIFMRKKKKKKKENRQKQGMVSQRMQILSYTLRRVNPNVRTNFRNPRYYTRVHEKSSTEKW